MLMIPGFENMSHPKAGKVKEKISVEVSINTILHIDQHIHDQSGKSALKLNAVFLRKAANITVYSGNFM